MGFVRYAFVDFSEKESVAKACALMAAGKYLDGFQPYIRASADERDGGKQKREGGHVHFGCKWDVVLMWEELDMDVVVRKPRVEKELFVNYATGINFDKYDTVAVNVEGDNIPPPLASVRFFFLLHFLLGGLSLQASLSIPFLQYAESGLHPLLKDNIARCGYAKPTPIQRYAIPLALQRRDLMACAQTGSGKTAAFLLPALHDIMTSGFKVSDQNYICPHTLILLPTRELTTQVSQEAAKVGVPLFCQNPSKIDFQLFIFLFFFFDFLPGS